MRTPGKRDSLILRVLLIILGWIVLEVVISKTVNHYTATDLSILLFFVVVIALGESLVEAVIKTYLTYRRK